LVNFILVIVASIMLASVIFFYYYGNGQHRIYMETSVMNYFKKNVYLSQKVHLKCPTKKATLHIQHVVSTLYKRKFSFLKRTFTNLYTITQRERLKATTKNY
jgi:hypothetical protein